VAQPYAGEIRMFGGSYAPMGWMFCEGQILSIAENETLFGAIGTTYGGDGQETFALPDLRGRLAIHQGNGFQPGQADGVEEVTLTPAQMAAHVHTLAATADQGTQSQAQGMALAQLASPSAFAYGTEQPLTTLSPDSVSYAGASQPHTNLQPYLCVSFIITLWGLVPEAN
jgi:microcystin-dependent protein